MANGHIYTNLQGLFANYVNLRPAQNWGLLQLTRTKHKANTSTCCVLLVQPQALPPRSQCCPRIPFGTPTPFFPSPSVGGTRMMVIQMLIVVGLRARSNFPLLVFPKSGFLCRGSAFVAAGHRFCVSKKQLVITPRRVLSTQPILTLDAFPWGAGHGTLR